MSYSLTITGHHGDPDTAQAIDDLLRAKGAELVAAVRELGHEPSSASFSGPSGYENFLAVAEDAAAAEPGDAPPDGT